MTDKIYKWILGLLWGISALLLSYTFGLIYFYNRYQRPSVQWSNIPFPMVTKFITPGDNLIFLVKRCSKESYSARIVREFVDGTSSSIVPTGVHFNKGCVIENRDISGATEHLLPGEYHLESHIEVRIHWLIYNRIDSYDTKTQTFTVINN